MSAQRVPKQHRFTGIAVLSVLIIVLFQVIPSVYADGVLIRIEGHPGRVTKLVEQLRGRVIRHYGSLNVIVADLPPQAITTLRTQLGSRNVFNDTVVPGPEPDDLPKLSRLSRSSSEVSSGLGIATASAADTMTASTLLESTCEINNPELHVKPLHANGLTGNGIIVATIDTGVRPGYPHLDSDASVIGGEDLVGDGVGFSSPANHSHGTAVAGMISGNAMLSFDQTDPVVKALVRYCPAAVLDLNPGDPLVQVPILGSAPAAKIYALRVFPAEGGSSLSVVLAAMDRVIELKQNFDLGAPAIRNPDGSYNALNIRVCNLSFGIRPIYPGHEIFDQMVDVMLENGILPVAAAGNAGPSGSTIGTPGTSHSALTVGGSSSATHERMYWDIIYGEGAGSLVRPAGGYQTATFSSRGPNADGRADPDVVANAVACVGQGFGGPSAIDLFSGTSYATAAISGVAAVLAQAAPSATARQIRNAILLSANGSLLADRSGPFDQGSGQANAEAALALLMAGGVPDTPGQPGIENPSVAVNLQGVGVPIYQGDVTRTVSSLLPGERFETYYRVTSNTFKVVIALSNFHANGTQNSVLGDQILLAVHDTNYGIDYKLKTYTVSGTFEITNVSEGFLRITVCGRWTNGGDVGVTLQIRSIPGALPPVSLVGQLIDQQTVTVQFQLPPGISSLNARVDWAGNFTFYPANNVDLVLMDPNGIRYLQGISDRNPERIQVAGPKPGTWTVNITGAEIHTGSEAYSLRLIADGLLIR